MRISRHARYYVFRSRMFNITRAENSIKSRPAPSGVARELQQCPGIMGHPVRSGVSSFHRGGTLFQL